MGAEDAPTTGAAWAAVPSEPAAGGDGPGTKPLSGGRGRPHARPWNLAPQRAFADGIQSRTRRRRPPWGYPGGPRAGNTTPPPLKPKGPSCFRSWRRQEAASPPERPHGTSPVHTCSSAQRHSGCASGLSLDGFKALSPWSFVTVDAGLIQTPKAVVVSWDDCRQRADGWQHLETLVAVGPRGQGLLVFGSGGGGAAQHLRCPGRSQARVTCRWGDPAPKW